MVGHRSKFSRFLRFSTFAALVLGGIAAILMVFWERLPYQSLANRQIHQILASYGLVVASLEVKTLTHNQARLSGITLGESHALHAGEVTANYSLKEVKRGKLRSLTLDGLALELYQTPEGWHAGGLEPLMRKKEGASSPFPMAKLYTMLPDTFTLTNARLDAANEDYAVSVNALQFEGHLDQEKKHWQGKFHITPALRIIGLPQEMPPLTAEGTFLIDGKKATLAMQAKDESGKTALGFSLSLPLENPEKTTFLLRHAQFPWGEGIISTKDVKISPANGQPIRLPLQLENVQLLSLLAAVSDGKVQGTGIINGTLPLTYFPDGRIALHEGGFQAAGSGQISVSPDALPAGTDGNLEMVRTALKNFYYDTLKITVSSGANDTPVIQLAVEGKSPDAFGERPVKLNVNLTGDVLPLLQQSIIPVNDVRKLLEQQDHP